MKSLTLFLVELIRRPLIFFWWTIRGWKAIGRLPDVPKMIVIGAPHTVGWDYIHMLVGATVFRRRPHVTAKIELFKPPLGWIIRGLGGIEIDRSAPHGVVYQIADAIKQAERMLVVFTPEGTRKYRDTWKTGFYYVAQRADVPIVCVAIDYKAKTVRFGLVVYPSGDIEKDFEPIKEFFETYGRNGYYPEKVNKVALSRQRKQENDSAEKTPAGN